MSIPAPETRIVTTRRVACDGGECALGHPRVWLQIPEDRNWVECPLLRCALCLRGAKPATDPATRLPAAA